MNLLVFTLFCLSILFPVLHLFYSTPSQRGMHDQKPADSKGISVLIPCFNEAAIIQTSIDHIQSLSYPSYEVIYINDGSNDKTFALLQEKLGLIECQKPALSQLAHKSIHGVYQSDFLPHVFVINKENGGKADSLNAGIEYASYDIVVTLDADSILSDDALPLANEAFQAPDVIAAGGMVHVLQTKADGHFGRLSLKNVNWLIRAQMFDLMKGFYITKVSLARFRALSIISGAFGIFDKRVLLEVGGYRTTLGEDIDITLRIQRYISDHPVKRIVFLPEAVCYTELPENNRDVFKQRVRWQKAFVDCIIHFAPFFIRTLFRKPVSFFCVFETFIGGTVTAYVITVMLIQQLALGSMSVMEHLILYAAVTMIFGLFCDVIAITRSHHYGVCFNKGEKGRLLTGILFDVTIFRFLNLFYVMYGTIAYFFNRNGWNKVARTGRSYKTEQPLHKEAA